MLLADAGYERVDQVEERGPVRRPRRHPRRLSGDRGAGGPGRAVRRRDRVAPLVLDLHPALARRRRAGGAGARGGARRRASRATRDDPEGFRAPLDLVPETALVAIAAGEEIPGGAARPLGGRDRGDARRRRPPPLRRPRRAARGRARAWRSSAADAGQEHSFRAQRADFPSRTLAEAEGELEKLVRSGYRTVVAFEGRGEAERTRFNLSRIDVPFLADKLAGGAGGELRRGEAPRGIPGARAEARRDPPAPPPPSPPGGHPGLGPRPPRRRDRAPGRRPRRPRGPRRRPLLGLRHQDPGGHHPRLPRARVPGRRQGLRPDRPARPDQPLRRRRWRGAPAQRRSGASAGRT